MSVRGYLLDVNMISHWYANHANVVAKINSLPADDLLYLSSIGLGEILYGHEINSPQDAASTASRKAFEQFLKDNLASHILEIDGDVSPEYAYLRSNLFNNFLPNASKQKKVEQLTDPATGVALGIQENDLWMAAQAITFNLVFVTNDKIRRIKEADVNKRLRVENWTS